MGRRRPLGALATRETSTWTGRYNCLRPGDRMLTGGKVRNPRAVEVLETLRRETSWDGGSKSPVSSPKPGTGGPETGDLGSGTRRGRGIALRYRHVGAGKTELLLRLLPDGTIEALTGNAD
jgi:hypothetical protein